MAAIAGLDLSLAGTAVVVLDDNGRPSSCLAFSAIKRDTAHAPTKHGLHIEIHPARAVTKGDTVADFMRTSSVSGAVQMFLRKQLRTGALVGIEDHAFGAKGAHIYQLGHLHGMVRRDVVRDAFRFVLLNITEVKQAATGKGGADKDQMVEAAAKALPLADYSRGVQEGLADAYAVARLTYFLDRAKRGAMTLSCLPPTMQKLMIDTKKKRGLLSRAVVGW